MLELDDIQGFLRHAYPYFPAASYCVFEIRDGASTKGWLRELLIPRSTDVDPFPDAYLDRAISGAEVLTYLQYGVTVAFTARGLERLGLPPDAMRTFTSEFQEGMVEERRSRLLGDTGRNAPQLWDWGGRGAVDGVLVVFASAEQLALRTGEVLAINGCPRIVHRRTGFLTQEAGTGVSREPFGFVDGISQPYVEGLTRKRPPAGVRPISPGEFVLGYRNAFGRFPASPSVAAGDDPRALLPRLAPDGRGDLGRNGTFLVMRELEQDVDGFQRFVGKDEELAARLVGRWRNGAPLVQNADPRLEYTQRQLEAGNGFGYHREDRYGFRCPVGAHARRANPRDALADELGLAREDAQEIADQHRLLRRGRAYEENNRKGLMFVCLNANIERQFEFVQSSWLLHPEFGGLRGETDPLLGVGDGRRMTLQDPLLGRCVEGLGQYITVKGGAYFFLPGLRALSYLAHLP